MTAEEARAELAVCAGTQFDPVKVRAFLDVSVGRLHAVAPLSWIGSLPFGNLGPQLARLAATGGRLGVAGVAATVGVVGLAAGQRAVASTHPTDLMATRGGGNGNAGSQAHDTGTTPSTGAGASSGRPVGSGGRGTSSSSPPRPGSTTAMANGPVGKAPTGSGYGGSGPNGSGTGGGAPGSVPGGGDPSGSGEGTTTTVASGSPPTVPTTTIGQSPPVSSTTTTTAPPPLVAPGSLTVKSGCQVLILAPEATLTWTSSPTTRVTGDTILRRSTKTGSYSTVASVTPRTVVSYTDTTVGGLRAVYWYKVVAVAGGESASSGPASMTTPTLCL
ncbi:MAG TPA: hypothetical protein VNC61_04255 [Acidimicrobiales bacterium]|nr:hypothetical protein [Acidimicrobiales bacterium]